MDHDAPRPAWIDRLRGEVDRAFVVTGAGTPGWPDPHERREDPREEEYSRVTDVAKYRILDGRVEAWVRALSDAGAAEARDVPAQTWSAGHRRADEYLRVRRVKPLRQNGLAVVLATTLVDGEAFGLDIGISRDGDRPILLASVPVCGCDACDDGSASLVEELDNWVLTVMRGGVLHARRGETSASRTFDGWQGAESWLDEAVPAPRGVERWVGAPWLDA